LNILDERGLFWWHDEPLPDRQFAPDSCVPGHLIIDEHGLSHLELDGALTVDEKTFFPMMGDDPAIHGKSIKGLLKGNKQHIVLCELRRDGGLGNAAGLSYERYVAYNCIASDISFPENEDISHIGSLEVNLQGFEEWLGLRSIEVISEQGGVSATYQKQDDLEYSLPNGKMSIRYFINRQPLPKVLRHTVTLKEAVFLRHTFSEKLTLEESKAEYRLLEDLLILLTNSEYSLDWPSISLSDDGRSYKLYFWRHRNPAPSPDRFECYPNFHLIRENFGEIFARWREQQDKL
jgi:ApeA N-terminal domain 1